MTRTPGEILGELIREAAARDGLPLRFVSKRDAAGHKWVQFRPRWYQWRLRRRFGSGGVR